jgi:tetratricopeptide (TPR) repeat protein
MNAPTSLTRNQTNAPHQSALGIRRGSGSPRRDGLKRGAIERRGHRAARPVISALSPTEQDSLLRQQSLSAARQGDYETALAGLTRLLERHPDSAKDYNNRGLVYLQAGQCAAALADYDQALRLAPRMASVYNNRANYYAAQGELDAAIADYERAIDLDPTNIRAWINQGITLRDLDMYPQAIENFDQALYIYQLVSRQPAPTDLLECHIYAQRGRTHHIAGDWNYAIADYQRALQQLTKPDGSRSVLLDRLHDQVNNWLGDLLCPF